MSNSNNIPLNWDNEQDNILFGSLFPNGLSAPNFASVKTDENPQKWLFLKESSTEVARNFKVAFPFSSENLTLIQEPNCPCEIKPDEIIVFHESGKNKGYQKGEDEYLFKIKIFSTTRGTSIEQAYFKCKVEEDEALFFIEDNTGDLSKAKMFAKFGSKVQKELIPKLGKESNFYKAMSKIPQVDAKVIEALIRNGVYEEEESILKTFVIGFYKAFSILNLPAKALGWLCESLGEIIIDYLSLPDSVWDSHSDAYFLKRENIIASLTIDASLLKNIKEWISNDDNQKIFSTQLPNYFNATVEKCLYIIARMIEQHNKTVTDYINELYDKYETTAIVLDIQNQLSEKVALFAGIWNGLVDFIGGLLIFIGQIAQLHYDITTDLEKFLEYFDEFIESFTSFDWSKLPEKIEAFYQEILNDLTNEDNTINYDKVAYFSGFTFAFIASLFIPFAAFAKPMDVIRKLKKGTVPTELIEKVSQATVQAGDVVVNASKKALNDVLALLKQITDLLAKGIDDVAAFLKDIRKKIAEWFKENLKQFQKVNKIANEADLLKFSKINKLKITVQDINTVLKLTQGRKDLAESILLSTKEIIEGKTVSQLIRIFKIKEVPELNSLSNYQARIWYTWQKTKIEKAIAKIKTLEGKAKKAFELRNEYRSATRQYMKDRKLAEYLEVVERNQEWEKLLEKTLKKEDVSGDLNKAYKKIMETSKTGNDGVDYLFKLNF